MLGNNLRFLRRRAGFGQDYIANLLGYKSYTTIQKWEEGTSEPPVSTLQRLADLYGVTMDSLINGDYETGAASAADTTTDAIVSSLEARPDLRSLFDACRKMTPEDLALVQAMVDRINGV